MCARDSPERLYKAYIIESYTIQCMCWRQTQKEAVKSIYINLETNLITYNNLGMIKEVCMLYRLIEDMREHMKRNSINPLT